MAETFPFGDLNHCLPRTSGLVLQGMALVPGQDMQAGGERSSARLQQQLPEPLGSSPTQGRLHFS